MLTTNIRNVTENKKRCWKTIKPFFTEKKTVKNFFTDKAKTSYNIILTENNQTVRKGKQIYQTFNKCFTNATKGLKLRQAEKFHLFENEERCSLTKVHHGEEKNYFLTQYLNMISKKQ